jgi:hypothetical protein
MCFAVAGAGIGAITSLLGTAVSAVGAIAGGQAQAAAADAQAQQDRNNAIIAQRNAQDAIDRGNAEEQSVQLRNRARLGMQKNVLSERNISVAGGSALDILGDTAMFGKLDALTTRNNAKREAIAYEAQSSNFSAQADINAMAADNYALAGGITAFSTALGGIGTFYQNTQKMTL